MAIRVLEPIGPLSEALGRGLAGPPGSPIAPAEPASDDPLRDLDLQRALYLAYELHFRGLEGVDDAWEWQPSLVAFRARLESRLLERIHAEVGEPSAESTDVGEFVFEALAADSAPPLARYMETQATLEQFREFVVHRSVYQLREADPHSFVIPRIDGGPKAAMVEIQTDEYGGGDPARMHSALFARAMRELGLDSAYGAYAERIPAETLATVNLMTLFGTHRRWRGALVGQFAAYEVSSSQPMRRYGNGLRRLGFGSAATTFFDEHVEADSVHENIAAYDLAGGLAKQEPQLAGDIAFGVRAMLLLEGAFAELLYEAFRSGRTSLLAAAPAEPALA